MKKIIIFCLLVLTNAVLISQPINISNSGLNEKLPRTYIGFSIPLGFQYIGGTYIPANESCNCNSMDVSHFDFNSGISLESYLLFDNFIYNNKQDSLSYGLFLALDYRSETMEASTEEKSRKVMYNNKITDLYEQSILEWSSNKLAFTLGLIIGTPLTETIFYDSLKKNKPNQFLIIGSNVSYLISQKSELYSEVVRPTDFMYLDGSQKKLIKEGDIENANDFRIGLNITYGVDWYLNQFIPSFKIPNVLLSTKIGIGYDVINIFDGSDVSDPYLFLKLGLLWQFDFYNN